MSLRPVPLTTRRLSVRRPVLLLGCLVVVIVLAYVAPIAVRLCREPVDVSGTTRLPGWLNALKQRDELAYPAHVLAGTLLEQIGCAPVAGGLQWLKAGAHARTETEVEMAGRGLAAARARSAQAEQFDTSLCTFVVDGFARPQQAVTVEFAGVVCP